MRHIGTRYALCVLVACGGPAPLPISAGPSPTLEPAPPPTPTTPPATTMAKPTMPSPNEIWTRVATDFTACYVAGKRAVPEMADGRITLHAAIDAAGTSTCVVPSGDTGLTQEVEDCMRERLARESYAANPAEWSTAIPVVVQGGVVSLGAISKPTSIDTIESLGLTEELYDVIEGLLPDAKDCLRGSEKSSSDPRLVVVVGAQVGKDGAVKCALASSTSSIAPEARRCVGGVFTKAHFKPPKRGLGLLSVPIEIVRR